MKRVFRLILAVIAGLVVGSFVNMALVMLSAHVIPPPAGVDTATTEGLKAAMPLFEPKQPGVIASLSARVGSIADNGLGGWYSYRAAKAAQNQLMRTLAVELKRSHPKLAVLQLHPGTVDTPLSGPFKARVPAGKLFTPELAAAQLLQVIEASTIADSGRFLAYDGSEIAW